MYVYDRLLAATWLHVYDRLLAATWLHVYDRLLAVTWLNVNDRLLAATWLNMLYLTSLFYQKLFKFLNDKKFININQVSWVII